MFDSAGVLRLCRPLPPAVRVAIVDQRGGPGILTVDACEANGLSVVPFCGAETRQRACGVSPGRRRASPIPVDMVASAGPDAYRTHRDDAHRRRKWTRRRRVHAGRPRRRRRDAAGHPRRHRRRPPRRRDGRTGARLPDGREPGGRSNWLAAGGERFPTYAYPENGSASPSPGRPRTPEWRAQHTALLWSFDDIPSTRHADLQGRSTRAATGADWRRSRRRWSGRLHWPLAAGRLAHSSRDEAARARRTCSGFPVAAKLAVALASRT
jgi:hypothetical protein